MWFLVIPAISSVRYEIRFDNKMKKEDEKACVIIVSCQVQDQYVLGEPTY